MIDLKIVEALMPERDELMAYITEHLVEVYPESKVLPGGAVIINDKIAVIAQVSSDLNCIFIVINYDSKPGFKLRMDKLDSKDFMMYMINSYLRNKIK